MSDSVGNQSLSSSTSQGFLGPLELLRTATDYYDLEANDASSEISNVGTSCVQQEDASLGTMPGMRTRPRKRKGHRKRCARQVPVEQKSPDLGTF